MRRSVLAIPFILFLFALGCNNPPTDPLFENATPEVLARGQSLTHGLAACGFCHGGSALPSSPFTGGQVFYDRYGAVTASNLTQVDGALRDWTAGDIESAMRANLSRDGAEISQELHRGYSWMSDRDLSAIALYLKTVPAAGEPQTRRSIGGFDRNVSGFLDSRKEVKGFVPSITKAYGKAYGRYLADNVAHCSGCHTMQDQDFKSKLYLSGGQTIRIGDDDKVAPNIRNGSDGSGIDKWSEQELINYLKTGVTHSGKNIDTRFCPVRFYARADDSDLASIAAFLKSK